MKIDLELAKQLFLKYTKEYDLSNDNIKKKQQHSLRVMQISETIAKYLNLSESEIELARLIGLLHDIARFEQYKQYQTFKDSISFDHGDYALKILENNNIRKYIKTDEFDDIIKKAIKNHNKLKIEDGLNNKEKLFAKIIRDADKIDILYASSEFRWNGIEKEIEESQISDGIFECIKQNKLIIRTKEKTFTKLDSVITSIAFVFDINFNISYEIIYKKDYINKILNKFDIKDEKTKNTVQEIRKIVNDYCKKRLQ